MNTVWVVYLNNKRYNKNYKTKLLGLDLGLRLPLMHAISLLSRRKDMSVEIAWEIW